MAGAFDSSFEALPRIIPIFPLPGALLLPHGKLPLNIFEPRYLKMTAAALAAERMIGMIQPNGLEGSDHPPVYEIGCAGRIAAFSETDDGRILLTLSGVCRFTVVEELPLKDGYRRVVADYHRYRDDLRQSDGVEIDRERLLGVLKGFLTQQGIDLNWKSIEGTDDVHLVTSLAMMCPFPTNEKQALLEAPDIPERARIMVALLEMALADSADGAGRTEQ